MWQQLCDQAHPNCRCFCFVLFSSWNQQRFDLKTPRNQPNPTNETKPNKINQKRETELIEGKMIRNTVLHSSAQDQFCSKHFSIKSQQLTIPIHGSFKAFLLLVALSCGQWRQKWKVIFRVTEGLIWACYGACINCKQVLGSTLEELEILLEYRFIFGRYYLKTMLKIMVSKHVLTA